MLFGDVINRHVVCNTTGNNKNILSLDAIDVCK